MDCVHSFYQDQFHSGSLYSGSWSCTARSLRRRSAASGMAQATSAQNSFEWSMRVRCAIS